MKQVRPEIQVKAGVTVRRGQIIGTSGMVSGRKLPFSAMLLFRHAEDAVWSRPWQSGCQRFGQSKTCLWVLLFPSSAGTAIYEGSTPYGLSAFRCCVTTEVLDITHESTKTRTLHKVGDDYQPVGKAALAVDYICEP